MSVRWICDICSKTEDYLFFMDYEGWFAPGNYQEVRISGLSGNQPGELVCSEECLKIACERAVKQTGQNLCPGSFLPQQQRPNSLDRGCSCCNLNPVFMVPHVKF